MVSKGGVRWLLQLVPVEYKIYVTYRKPLVQKATMLQRRIQVLFEENQA